ALAFAATPAFAQDASQVQKLFEAGQYQRVVESAQPDGDPAVLYTAAQSHQKLGENDRAVETYGALAACDERRDGGSALPARSRPREAPGVAAGGRGIRPRPSDQPDERVCPLLRRAD